MARLPNFLIIGAGKSGTTSLHHYLSQHPSVFMSTPKELRYFIFDDVARRRLAEDPSLSEYYVCRDLDSYRARFVDAGEATAVGESSPQYMARPGAAEKIRDTLGDVRVVAILRNPVDRAFSSYGMYRTRGEDRRTFERAIEDELAGFETHVPIGSRHYLGYGQYARQLEPYFELFPSERRLVLLYDDLVDDQAAVLRRLFGFLGVDEDFEPDTSVRYNTSGSVKNRLVHKMTDKNRITAGLKRHLPAAVRKPLHRWALSRRAANLAPLAMRPETRARLIDYFRDDVRRLSELIGRNLDAWLSPHEGAGSSPRGRTPDAPFMDSPR